MSEETQARKPKIYLFVNGERGTDWQHSIAVAEDGHCLAGHISSDEWFAKHDIGLTSDWHHDSYREHYPDGYEVEWVDDPRTHEGLLAAFALNQLLAEVPA